MSELQNEYENLIELLEDRVQQTPEKIAYIVLKFEKEEKEEISLTYKDVYDNARAIAVSLKKRGLTKGDRVIILSSQTCDNIYSIYGAIFAEAIFTIIPPPTDESKKQRFKSVLESSEARFILYNDLMAKELEESLYQLQSPEKGVAEETGKLISPEIFNVENYEREPREWVKPEVTSDTFVCLQYSSGSTNHPKGIIITHGNIISNLEALMKSFVKDGLQTSVSWVPIFHNMGLMGTIFANVYYDIKSVIMSPVAFMENPLRWFRTVTDYKGNMILSPNSSYEFCTKVIDDHDLEGIDLSTVKLAINGSEPVNFNTLQNFANKFGKCGFQLSAFWLGYGLAESTAFVSAAMFNSKFKWVDYESMQKNLFVESTDEKAIRKVFQHS